MKTEVLFRETFTYHCPVGIVTLSGLEQPLHKWSGIFTQEVVTCQNWGISQKILKCALSVIESEGIFMFQTSLHILL